MPGWHRRTGADSTGRRETRSANDAGFLRQIRCYFTGIPWPTTAEARTAVLNYEYGHASVAVHSNVTPPDWPSCIPAEDIGRELFCLVVRAREAGRDAEMEPRAAVRRYPRPRARLEAFMVLRILFRLRSPSCPVGLQPVTSRPR